MTVDQLLPNPTLYIQNLNDKINKNEMRRSLYALFSSYGLILSINLKRTKELRGQAFLVFDSVISSTSALRSLQGFEFYGLKIKLYYAKSKSVATMVQEGKYIPKEVRDKEKQKSTVSAGPSLKRTRDEDGNVAVVDVDDEDEADETDETIEPAAKKSKESRNKPNKLLFLTALPPKTTVESLTALFSQYPGFHEIRLVPGKEDIAFVEFKTIKQAGVALDALDGFKISAGKVMNVDYAK